MNMAIKPKVHDAYKKEVNIVTWKYTWSVSLYYEKIVIQVNRK